MRVPLTHLARRRDVDEGVDVDIDKGGHQELAVKPVHDAAMAGDDVSKVFDLEGSLEARGKEAAKWSNNGSKERHEESVDKKGVYSDGLLHVENSPPGGHGLDRVSWERRPPVAGCTPAA